MTRPGFIEAALGAIREALETAADKAGLILRHYEPSRSAARRFRASVARLETMFRRLLVILAEQVVLEAAKRSRKENAPVIPEAAKPLSGTPSPNPLPISTLPQVAVNAAAQPRRKPFRLVPPLPATDEQLERLRALPASSGAGRNCTVSGRLLDRYRTLMRALAEPDRHARRMARRLAALKAAGELAPMVQSETNLHRFPADLGLIAALLPDLTRQALRTFFDSG